MDYGWENDRNEVKRDKKVKEEAII